MRCLFFYFYVFDSQMGSNNPVTIQQLYALFRQFRSITTDSRHVPPQSVFFALKGDSFDGNMFAQTALEQGAAIAVVDNSEVVRDDRYFLVGEVLSALQELAVFHRKQVKIPVIGITGSNGKTTTKELMNSVLSKEYRTVSTTGNLNNHIGVPLTVLSIKHDTEIAVIEMGANHPGEITLLCEIAMPTHGLITNIGLAHLEGFGGFEGVVRGKTELYGFLRKQNGVVFLNLGDPLLGRLSEGMNTLSYGLVPDASVSGTTMEDKTGITLLVKFPDGRTGRIRSLLFGKYNALNILSAICAGTTFGVSVGNIMKAIESFIPGNNRSQLKRTDRNLLVLDAYNANPSSMAAALHDFNGAFPERKIAILGDMLELGNETETEHQRILALLDDLDIDQVFLVGPVFSRLNRNKHWHTFAGSHEACDWFSVHPLRDSYILLKASRGIHLEEIIPAL